MTIPLLRNSEAFFLMLRVLLCSTNRSIRDSIVRFIKQFCEIRDSDWNHSYDVRLQKAMFAYKKQRNIRRYAQLTIKCQPPTKLLNQLQAADSFGMTPKNKFRRLITSPRKRSRSNSSRLTRSSKSDANSRHLLQILNRSVKRMNEKQRKSIRNKLIINRPDASKMANQVFLKQLLLQRKKQSSNFLLIATAGLNPVYCTIGSNQTCILHVPLPLNRKSKIIQLTLRRLSPSKFCYFRWKFLGQFQFDMRKVSVLSGTNFQLVSGLSNQYMLLKSNVNQNLSDSWHKDSTSTSQLETVQSDLDELSRGNDEKELATNLHEMLTEKNFRPTFFIRAEWEPSNPFDRILQTKHEFGHRYLQAMYEHVQLVKFILVKQLHNSPLIQHGETLERLLTTHRMQRFVGSRLQNILNNHAFQSRLNRSDHQICVQVAIADVRLLRQEFTKADLNLNATQMQLQTLFNSTQSDQSLNHLNGLSTELQSLSLTLKSLFVNDSKSLAHPSNEKALVQIGTSLIKAVKLNQKGEILQNTLLKMKGTETIEQAHKLLTLSGDIRPLEQLSQRRILEWNLVGHGWSDQRSQRLQQFNSRSMIGRYLDDFDLDTQNVCLRVCAAFGDGCRFVRFNLQKSLTVLPFDHLFRRVVICIICNRFYQLFLSLLTIHQLFIIQPTMSVRRLYRHYSHYVFIFTGDMMLQILGKGLCMHTYSYLQSFPNLILSLCCLSSWTLMLKLTGLKTNTVQFLTMSRERLTGIVQLILILQCIRLIRLLMRFKIFRPFRLFVQVIASLLPQLLPVVLLWIASLLYLTQFTRHVFPKLFRQLCVPNRRWFQLEHLAINVEKENLNYLKYESMEEAYTRINYNNSLYLFDYRPCGYNREHFLAAQCPPFDKCIPMSTDFQFLVGRLPPDLLNFERYSTTVMILAMAMFNQNFDAYFYRMVRSAGLLGFVTGISALVFGFLMLSLVLSMIYDTYQEHMTRMHVFQPNQSHYYAGESEFSFNPRNLSVCYRAALLPDNEKQLIKAEKNKQIEQQQKEEQQQHSTVNKEMDSQTKIPVDALSNDDSKLLKDWTSKVYRPACQPFDAHTINQMQLIRRTVHSTVLQDAHASSYKPSKVNMTSSSSLRIENKETDQEVQVKIQTNNKDSAYKVNRTSSVLSLKRQKSRIEDSDSQSDEDTPHDNLPMLSNFINQFSEQQHKPKRFQFLIQLRWIIIDFLQRFTNNRLFFICIDGLVLFKLVLFVIQVQAYVFMRQKDERIKVETKVIQLSTTILYVYLIEFAVRWLAGGRRVFHNPFFKLEVSIVLLDLFLQAYFNCTRQVFSNFRILRLLYLRWPLLQLLASAVSASRLELTSNMVFFTVVFAFLAVFADRFFENFQVESEEEDYLRIELDFASWDRTARTVYLSMVSLAWPEIVSQYLLFNFEYAPSIYLFRQVNKTMKSYIDKLPYAFLLFTLGCICYSLFFRNLFIPQVFHYLDVNQVLGTNNLLKLQSDVVNRSVINLMEIRKQFQQPSSLVDSQMLTAFNEAWNAIKNNFISPFLFGNYSPESRRSRLIQLIRSYLIYINIIAITLIFIFQWPFVYVGYNDLKLVTNESLNMYLFIFALFLHLLLLLNLFDRARQKGLLLFLFGYQSKCSLWRIIVALIDVGTLFASCAFLYEYFNVVIVLKQEQKDINIYALNISLASVLRLLRLFSRTRRWAKGACMVWTGFLDSMAICFLIVFTFAALGSAFLFRGWTYCSLVQAGWFPQKTRRVALSTPSDFERCKEEKWKNDYFIQHGLSYMINTRLHPFNMQNIFSSVNFVLHAMFGSDLLSSIELVTKFDSNKNKFKQTTADISWLYIVPTTMFGLILDAFIFTIIARQMSFVGNFAGRSVLLLIKDRAMIGTLLALDNLNYSEPWRDALLVHKNWIVRVLHRLVNNRLYRLFQLVILLGNIPISLYAINHLSIAQAHYVEQFLLLNSVFDGIIRIIVVGPRLFFQYPAYFFYDIVFPLLCCTLHLSGIRFGSQTQWSMFLPIRILALPDRYLSVIGANGPRMLLRTVVAAAKQLFSVATLLLIFLILISGMTVRQWHWTEELGHVFEPPELPITYDSILFTLTHLISIVFTGSYDGAILAFQQRASFCLIAEPEVNIHQNVLALIRDAIDKSPPTFLYQATDSSVHHFNQSTMNRFENWPTNQTHEVYQNDIQYLEDLPNDFGELNNFIKKQNPMPLFYTLYDAKSQDFMILFTDLLQELVSNIQARCLAMKFRSKIPPRFWRVCNLKGISLQSSHFFIPLNYFYRELLVELLFQRNTISSIEKNDMFDRVYTFNMYNRISTSNSREEGRLNGHSKLDQLVERFLYFTFHNALNTQRERTAISNIALGNREICANQSYIQLFYTLIFLIGRFVILNMFRAVVMNRYELERLRFTNAIWTNDVDDFLNQWQLYCVCIRAKTNAAHTFKDSRVMVGRRNGEKAIVPLDPIAARVLQQQQKANWSSVPEHKDTGHLHLNPATLTRDFEAIEINQANQNTNAFSFWSFGKKPHSNENLYLPIRYALLFLREMAPLKFRLPACSEESALCILGRYSLRVRESDMTVHGFDLLAVCCAYRLKCEPQTFQNDFKYVVQTLADAIYRKCPDYDFREKQFITMPAYLNGFYFGKLLLNIVLQRKILNYTTHRRRINS